MNNLKEINNIIKSIESNRHSKKCLIAFNNNLINELSKKIDEVKNDLILKIWNDTNLKNEKIRSATLEIELNKSVPGMFAQKLKLENENNQIELDLRENLTNLNFEKRNYEIALIEVNNNVR